MAILHTARSTAGRIANALCAGYAAEVGWSVNGTEIDLLWAVTFQLMKDLDVTAALETYRCPVGKEREPDT